MLKRPLILLLLVAALVGAGLALAGAFDDPAGGPDATEAAAPQRVETAAVLAADAVSTLRFAGTVRSARRARVSFSVAGRVIERPVVVGDRVAAGQRLARLESDELGNALAAAEAAVGEARARAEQAERERRRVERLAESKAATGEELEQVRAAADTSAAAVRRAEAGLDEARRRAGEATVAAPWAGTVTEVLAQPGEYLSAGDPVVELSGDGRPEIEVRLPESFLAGLAPGDAVRVALPFAGGGGGEGDATVAGMVRSVGAAAGGAGRLFPALVDLPADSGLAPGRAAEVLVTRRSGGGLSVPLSAILNPGGSRPVVFRVEGAGGAATAVEVPVRVEDLAGERVVVVASAAAAPLAAGDRVVVAGHLGLIDGDPVEPVASRRAGSTSAAEPATGEAR